jgi:hypothetical protein
MYRKQDGSIHTLVRHRWADTFSIYNNCISPTLELMKLQPIDMTFTWIK